MEKKGQKALWFSIIGVVLFALIVIFIVIIANTGKEEKISEETLNLYVNSVDSETGVPLESEYLVADNEGNIYGRGKTDKTSLIQVKNKVPEEKEITLYCWGDHYFSKIEHNFTSIEKMSNSSKMTCRQNPVGSLEITHEGDLKEINNRITLKIKAEKYFKDLSAVFIWSPGIINVNFEEQKIFCNNWTNSSYNLNLPEDNYLCEGKVYVCEKIEENNCILKQEVPPRFFPNIDKVIYTGKDLSSETYELTIDVKTEEMKNQNDYLEIIFYDNDLIYEEGLNQWSLVSEYNDENLGGKDFAHRIDYIP